MRGEHLDAASTGYRVGYDDASYFNRKYKNSSAFRRCVTWSGCRQPPGQVQAMELIKNW
jgi:AraC-like DNA-binding protein